MPTKKKRLQPSLTPGGGITKATNFTLGPEVLAVLDGIVARSGPGANRSSVLRRLILEAGR